jgi:PAS domain S-box-containing protein
MAKRKVDERLIELENLKKENSELKSLLQSQNVRYERTDETITKERATLLQINDFSLKLANLPHNELFPFIASQIKSIFGVKAALINTYDEATSELVLQFTTLSDEENSNLTKLLGGKLLNKRTHVSKKEHERILSNIYEKIASINELTFGAIPDIIGKSVEKLFGIDWFAALALVHNEKLAGTIILAGDKTQSYPEKEIILAFAGIAANALVRKETEEKLLEIEGRYRNIVENSPYGMHIYELQADDKLLFIGANPAADKILGFEHKSKIGLTIEEAFPSLVETEVPSKYKKVIKSNSVWKTEQINYKDDKVIGAFEVFAFRISENQMVARFLEITERIQREQTLKESQEYLAITLNSIGDGVISTDKVGCITNMNPVAETLCGWKLEDAVGKPLDQVFVIVEASSKVKLSNPVEKVIKTGKVVELSNHTLLISKEGKERNISDSAAPILDKDNNIHGVVLVFSDVTEAYNSRKAIQASEERLRLTAQLAKVGGWEIDLQNESLNWAEETFKIHELETKQVPTLAEAKLFYHPDDQLLVSEKIQHATEKGTNFDFEARLITAKKNNIWVRVVGNPIYKDSKLIGLSGMIQDITERKMFEIEIKNEKERIGTILDLVGDPIFVKDNNHQFTLANRAFYEMTGLNKLNVIGRTLADDIPEEEMDSFLNIDRQVLDTGIPDVREEELTINNETKTIITSKVRFIDESGNKYLVGSIHDISERKKNEKIIKESERKYRLLFENNPQPMWVYDLETLSFLAVNDAAVFKYGYSRDEFLQMTIKDIRPSEDISRLLNNVSSVTSGIYNSGVWRHCKKDGSIIFVEITSYVLEFEGRKSELILSNDITDRINAEREKAHFNELMKFVISNTKSSVSVFNTEMNYIYVSDRYFDDFHLTDKNIIGRNHYDIFPDLPQQLRDVHKRALNGETLSGENDILMHKDGSMDWANWTCMPWYKADATIGGVIIYIEVITERRKVEERVKLLAQMVNIAPGGIIIHDFEGQILYANDRAAQMHGCTNEEFINLSLLDIDVPETADLIRTRMTELELNGEINFEGGHRRKDGSIYPVQVYAKKIDWASKPAILSITTDISERKLAEENLKKSEERFSQAIAGTGAGLWDWDMINDRVYFSQQWKSMLGYQNHEVENSFSGWKNLWHPDDAEIIEKAVDDYLQSRSPIYEVVHRLKHKDGDWRWILTRGDIHRDSSGKPVRWIGTNIDITESKKAGEELERTKIQLKESIMQSPLPMVLASAEDFKVKVINKATEDFLLLNANDYLEKTLLEIDVVWQEYTPEGIKVEPDELPLPRALQGMITHSKEMKLVRWDGSIVWQLASGAPIFDSHGKLIAGLLVMQDITERKLAEKAIKESEELYRKLLTTVPDLIIRTDLNGNITFINEFVFPALKFIPRESLLGKNMLSFITTEDLPRAIENTKLMFEGPLGPKEYKLRFEDGEFIDAEVNGDVIYDAENNAVGMVYVVRNITERKQMEIEKQKMFEDLVAAKEKAEEMNKAKSNFFSNMSHELRTPFVGIMGFAELLNNSLKNPNEKFMAEGILKASARMQDTLSKILELSRLESDEIQVEKRLFNANELITDLCDSFKGGALLKKISFEMKLNFENLIMESDDTIIKDIVQNFLNNAIKFTNTGKIELIADVVKTDDEESLVIKVADTGVGIPKEKLDLIWEPFRQASEGLSRRFEGTGLGLSIVKKSAELLGGKLNVESEEGKGSVFTFILPLNKIDAENIFVVQNNEVTVNLFSGKKIIYVEDDEYARDIVERILNGISEIETAATPDEALQKVQSALFDIVLMDINLKHNINGVELAQEIRKLPGYHDKPIVAVTAYASVSEKANFLSKGFTHYIAKPFKKTELISLLNSIFIENKE